MRRKAGVAPGEQKLSPLVAQQTLVQQQADSLVAEEELCRVSSGGGQFGLYVLFNNSESVDKYIIGSPAVYQPWLDMKAARFEKHKDLDAKVFLSAGESEAVHPVWAAGQIALETVLVAERLTTRKVPVTRASLPDLSR